MTVISREMSPGLRGSWKASKEVTLKFRLKVGIYQIRGVGWAGREQAESTCKEALISSRNREKPV